MIVCEECGDEFDEDDVTDVGGHDYCYACANDFETEYYDNNSYGYCDYKEEEK